MKTVRDHIAGNRSVPSPPRDATHVLCWEPCPPQATRWEVVSLDARPDDGGMVSGLPADASAAALGVFASSALGCPVGLSSRLEMRDGAHTAVAYYVTPAGGR